MNKERIDCLVSDAKEDPEAFGELYDHFQYTIFRYVARRIPNRSDAEDVTAHVFEKALGGIGGFIPTKASFQTWLYRIAHNCVVDYYRKEGNRSLTTLEDAESLYGLEQETDHEYLRRYVLMLGLLSELPAAQQEVLTLRFMENLPNQEIADVLGCSNRHVAVKIYRALKSLRRLAVERGIIEEIEEID